MHKIKPLTVGPIVGHTDQQHARIWGRAEYEPLAAGPPRRAFGIARFRKKEDDAYGKPRFFKMNPNFDMSGVVAFTNLTPDTQFQYQIGWFFSDKEMDELDADAQWGWNLADQGMFVTTSADAEQSREFVFGSCRYLLRLFGGRWFDDRGDKTFRSILRQIEDRPISKLLMIGDQIYADDLNALSPDKEVDEYLIRYRDVFSQPYIKRLMSNVSTYMTMDDHEIEDNWPSQANEKDLMWKYPAAVHAYEIYQMSHSPLQKLSANGRLQGVPTHYYYTFSDGCCDFFVTDTRTERDPDDQEIISDKQMDALLAWLSDGSGRVKCVASAVPFFPDTKKANEDKWSGYLTQRDGIINHIRQNDVRKVVFLSGDVHCSMAATLNIANEQDPPHHIYSVISSAFYWPYPHMKQKNFRLTGFVASSTNQEAYSLGERSDVFSGDNFTRVKVSPSTLRVEVYERKGTLEHTKEFRF